VCLQVIWKRKLEMALWKTDSVHTHWLCVGCLVDFYGGVSALVMVSSISLSL
jgi:hypothetical protein